MDRYILAFDSGTTSNRAILFDHNGNIAGISQKEFEQIFPKPGWVEHDPEEIWSTQKFVVRDVLRDNNIDAAQVAAIGITNQRETTLVWERASGKPVYNAIVWQDRRTAATCDQLRKDKLDGKIQQKTGLVVDAYFSGSKVKWILDNVPGAREKAEKGELAFGTVDTWLIWRLTHGKVHVTDVSNASRTMLFNIHTLEWDDELLEILDIPKNILPEVRSCSEVYGHTVKEHFGGEIPIAGIAGDQQAALFGQMCVSPGMIKNTYGTGCFAMMNIGEKAILSRNNLLTTIAWQLDGKVHYALEGSIFIGGAVVQWLRDRLHIVNAASEIEQLALTVEDSGGVFFVPAFVGLGAPHWDQYARGAIFGITRGTTDAHIARAALEAIALQSADVIETMTRDSGIDPAELRVDGGAAVNNLLMQTQADIAGIKVVRPKVTETTALGAAYLAGLAIGFWENVEQIQQQWAVERVFEPQANREKLESTVKHWRRAIERSKKWLDE